MINRNIRKFVVKSGLMSMGDFEVERLIRNAIRTPDGTVLESLHVHDYRTYTDANGFTYMVDGGLEYLRRNVVREAPHEELSVYVDEDHEINREWFMWGNRGPMGNQTLQYRSLKSMSTDHIEAILKTQTQIKGSWGEELFKAELAYRSSLG